MSLDYNVRDVENFEYVCYTPDENGEQILSVKTSALVWLMLAIGMSEITKDNYIDVYKRIAAHEHINGAYLNYKEGPRLMNLDDIKEHIGLRTNVTDLTDAQFQKQIWRDLLRSIGVTNGS